MIYDQKIIFLVRGSVVGIIILFYNYLIVDKKRILVILPRLFLSRVPMKNLLALLLIILCVPGFMARGQVVADISSRLPLQGASVFTGSGRLLGVTDRSGRIPVTGSVNGLLIVRYLGYGEMVIEAGSTDTVFMAVKATALPEVLVESPRLKVLHILGYVREYSTLSTLSDTVFMYREKMVDYMLTPDRSMKFKGWTNPRVLKSNSYYRFSDHRGLDSVSDKCGHHFSWSDWVGIIPSPRMPHSIREVEYGTDTLHGKYSAAEIWRRSDSRVTVDVDVLADASGESRKWVPGLSGFFREDLDFERFKLHIDYRNVIGNEISDRDLAGYSFVIESEGRGRDMFMFKRKDEKFSVSTYAEVYVLDREYISVKEARKWKEMKFDIESLAIVEPPEAPELQPHIRQLIARVDGIDHTGVRLDFTPDERLAGAPHPVEHLGTRLLNVLKLATGISHVRGERNFKRKWNEFVGQLRDSNKKLRLPPEQPLDSGDKKTEGSHVEGKVLDAGR